MEHLTNRARGLIIGGIAALMLSAASARAADPVVGGITVAERVTHDGRSLRLIGAGVRVKFVFNVYLAALYAAQPSHDAARLIADPQPRRIHLQLLRDIDSATLDEALQDGLAANHNASDIAALKPAAAQLSALLKSMGGLREGDIIDLDIQAGSVAITYNQQSKGSIEDPQLPSALMRIWLGPKPAQSSLKQALLGQTP